MSKLFVYGIFLSHYMREQYDLYDPHYAVVVDYTTVRLGGSIVAAIHIPGANLGLTGLVCEVKDDNYLKLDMLEAAYDRVTITTEADEECYMYVQPRERD